MRPEELRKTVEDLVKLPAETEWVEFKVNNVNPQEIGEYISALSNSACLHNQSYGYLVFGVQNKTHKIVGTGFRPKTEKVGNEELENWLTHLLDPRIDFNIGQISMDGKDMILFRVDATPNIPVKFKGMAYVRIGSYKKKLKEHPEKERKIWQKGGEDWSAQICEGAALSDLDPQAVKKARHEYKLKNPKLSSDVDEWDDNSFLNKAKLAINGRITRAAILLLGKLESEHYISPSVAKISWILKDERNHEKDYEHLGPPFILNADVVLSKIRNLKYRFLPDNTLFPVEILQYEPYVIREALHNSIAHQDYEFQSRIIVVEKPDELIFTNAGNFIPGSVEEVIRTDAPQKYYRNAFLAEAMVNLNMIDTIGGGIKKMFQIQKDRFFPLPTYKLEKQSEVTVIVAGKIIDENYTKLLMRRPDLDLKTVMLLDKVQKNELIAKEEAKFLKKQRLIEGRYPKVFIASQIAALIGDKSRYIKNRGLDKQYYKKLILDFIREYGSATRKDIDDLLFEKLPNVLNAEQKKIKVNNLLNEMANKDKSIKNEGSDRRPKWVSR